jgi:hypothetical protein
MSMLAKDAFCEDARRRSFKPPNQRRARASAAATASAKPHSSAHLREEHSAEAA